MKTAVEREPESVSAGPGDLDRIACDGCGRWFMTVDGAALLACIRGRCPDCGGSFGLAADDSLRS